jgi:hypothetical protein
MSVQIETVLISGAVAIIVAILTVGGPFSIGRKQLKQNEKNFQGEQADRQKEFQAQLDKFRDEQKKWIINLETAYELERYKARIASYPQAFSIIGKLSHKAREPVTPEKAKQVAYELNDWFYSIGGMCADISTRGAIRLLRRACLTWGKQGSRPSEFYTWRNSALLLLRNDLGLQGLEDLELSDTEDMTTLIERVKCKVALSTKEEVALSTKEEVAK